MRRLIAFLSTTSILASMAACTPEKIFWGGNDNPGNKTVHVTGVSLNRTSATIKEGESVSLFATVAPDNADNKNVIWSSSSDVVATVDNSGEVTGLKAGSATITATTEDGGMKATCALSVEVNLAPSVTGEANHISAISAVLSGKANLGSTVAVDLKVGFQYSKSAGILPSNSTTVEATDADANYNYMTSITGLEPATKYYFRSFVRQNGQDTYGETKEFSTKELSSLLHTQEATAISAVSAKLNADLDLTDVQYKSKTFGFYWGTSAESILKVTASEGTGTIFADLSSLAPSKQYFYRAFVVLDGKEFKETVLSLTTKNIESILETKDPTDIELASAKLNAKLDLTDVKYNSISYGFLWSRSEASQHENLQGGEIIDNVYSSSLTDLIHKSQYWYKAYVILDSQTFVGDVKKFSPAGPLDLGLSVYWATCNLSEGGFVSTPEAYGDYYAWGETETKSNYSWSTYKFGTSSSGPFSKYNTKSTYGTVDNKTTLDPEDDVAHVKLGGKWRMPTDAEWTELRNNCTWTWTTTRKGVKGMLVKSKTNGNSIFLPVRNATLPYSYGLYWSSSLDTGNPYRALGVYFDSGGVLNVSVVRSDELFVRPVTE